MSSRLPACVVGTRFEPGATMPQNADVLAAIVSTITRCAPWVRLYLGPRVWSTVDACEIDAYSCRPNVKILPDGCVDYEHHGIAYTTEDVIMIASSARLTAVMPTLHHEIWHSVERMHLQEDDISVVNRAVVCGQSRPGAYLNSSIERRARLYEAWSTAVDEGWRPMSIAGRPVRRLDRVMAYVYGGYLACDIAAGRPARCQRARWHSVALWLHWVLIARAGAPYPL